MFFLFFFNDTATTEIYTLSLHDALPISFILQRLGRAIFCFVECFLVTPAHRRSEIRSEEHTSELQSRSDLVCRLLLEKKKISSRPRPWGTHQRRVRSRPATPTSPQYTSP